MRTIGSADTHGEINAVASGAITKGIPVVVNTDAQLVLLQVHIEIQVLVLLYKLMALIIVHK